MDRPHEVIKGVEKFPFIETDNQKIIRSNMYRIVEDKLGTEYILDICKSLPIDENNITVPDLVVRDKSGVIMFIMEVASRDSFSYSMCQKDKLYNAIGVKDYYVFDDWFGSLTIYRYTTDFDINALWYFDELYDNFKLLRDWECWDIRDEEERLAFIEKKCNPAFNPLLIPEVAFDTRDFFRGYNREV